MKTFNERLLDYMESHPLYNATCVYDQVMDKHKRAIWKMQHRIKERIQFMLTSNESAFFLTFTFDDNHLPSTEEESKTQQYIIDYLKQNNASAYVANTDYGKTNNRFHWHAVVQAPNDMDNESWIYGAIQFKRIKTNSLPIVLSRYLIKLQRHATKVKDPLMLYYPIRYRRGELDD